MCADIQGEADAAQGSTVGSRMRGKEQLTAQAGSDSPTPHPSTPAVRAWSNGQFTYRTLGQCSRTDGPSKLALHIQEGVCSRQHAWEQHTQRKVCEQMYTHA